MQISDENLTKFIELHQKRFGVVLDRESGREKAFKLLQLIKITYKPLTINDHEKYSAEIQQYTKEKS